MNIGIVCYPTYGGSGVIATELGKALALQGHNIHFITYSRPIRLDTFMDNIFFHEVRIPNYPLFETPPYESALASMMVDVARYHHIDLFHVHYALPHASVAYLAKQILKTYQLEIPTIVTLHGTDITVVGKDKSYEPVVSFAINQSEGVTAVSDSLRKDTYQNFNIQKEICVIPNFVDIKRFTRQNKEHFRRMLAPNRERILIHTSNFRKVKRSEEVIKIFSEIRKTIPCKLLMVGDGPERQTAEEMCRELNTCEDVRFLGNQNAVEEIYSIADVFVMPSESESFGLAALEAMSCGVPVISSNAGGLPEVVKDNYNGFVCEVGDVKKMSEKTLFLLKNAEIWQQFSHQARISAEQYAIHHILPQYETLYQEVLQRKQMNS